MSIAQQLTDLKSKLPEQVSLVAVSKTKPLSAIMEAYQVGHRVFGENKVQELVEKHEQLPKDIEWHMIGHLQRNKVKYIAPFVSLIHGVDNLKLLKEINKQGEKNNRVINYLLQIKIATEDNKYGMTNSEARDVLQSEVFSELNHISIKGVMGMATFTSDVSQIKSEFNSLKTIFKDLKTIQPKLEIISMGMSGDYQLAIDCGSTMIRVGSHIFGVRNYSK